MSTNMMGNGECHVYLTQDRRNHIAGLCTEVESARKITAKRLKAILCTLVFCTKVIPSINTWLYSGFHQLRGNTGQEIKPTRTVRKDIAFVRRTLTQSNSLGRCLVTRQETSSPWRWDASTKFGIGGYYKQGYFSQTWAQIETLPMAGKPKKGTPTEHINYGELFAGFFSLVKWGEKINHMALNCESDNTVTVAMLNSMKGEPTFIPLLKEIQLMCARYDIEIRCKWIGTKQNFLADALSRGDIKMFLDNR
jgi:hypothetical protein